MVEKRYDFSIKWVYFLILCRIYSMHFGYNNIEVFIIFLMNIDFLKNSYITFRIFLTKKGVKYTIL